MNREQYMKNDTKNKSIKKVARPRLVAFRSNAAIYAQIIDDTLGKTLVAASSKEIKDKKTPIETAALVGKLVGEKALKANLKDVVFDRNGFRYHGRIKSLADGARAAGLTF